MNTIGPTAPLLGLSQRMPPSNVAAEQALLGALLANNKAYERVSDFLVPEHFADPIHGRIFQAISRRVEAGQLADVITLKAEFEHSGVLEEVGGTAYLSQLLAAMVGIINAGEYGRAIHDAWLRRQLIDIGETVVNNAFGAEPELDGSGQVEAAEQRCSTCRRRGRGRRLRHLRAGADGGDPQGGARLPPVRRRLGPVDRAARPRQEDRRAAPVRPHHPGRAARHGQDGARHQDRVRRGTGAAGGGAPGRPDGVPKGSVAVFSLEMSAEQLATRLLSEEARVSGDRIRRGDIGQKDFDRFVPSAASSAACRCTSTTRRRSRCRRCARAAAG